VNFEFYESDYNSSALEAEWGMDTYNWVSQFQSETEWGTMTAYIAHEVLASYMSCNIDGASQYFNGNCSPLWPAPLTLFDLSTAPEVL